MTSIFGKMLAAAAILQFATSSIAAAAEIPVPTPRPALKAGEVMTAPGKSKVHPKGEGKQAAAEAGEREVDAEDTQREPLVEPVEPARQTVFDPVAARECEKKLQAVGVKFKVGEPIIADHPCGVDRPILISAIGEIEARGSPRLNCDTALALGQWVRQVVIPSARMHLGRELTAIDFSTSYQCRRRNNAKTGKYSEHAFGNGIDIMGFRFADDSLIDVRKRDADPAEIAFQAATRGGACAYFTTVLGPGANAAHATHFHFDLAERRGGYRLCE